MPMQIGGCVGDKKQLQEINSCLYVHPQWSRVINHFKQKEGEEGKKKKGTSMLHHRLVNRLVKINKKKITSWTKERALNQSDIHL